MSEQGPWAEAVIAVDVQHAFFTGGQVVEGASGLLRRLDALLVRARNVDARVVLVRNDGVAPEPDAVGTPGWELALAPGPQDVVLGKQTDDGFEGTDLAVQLQQAGVRTVVVVGVFSEMCVAATARGAKRAGFTVIVAHDGHSTLPTPAWPGIAGQVPAPIVSRVAEWSLGDEVLLVPRTASVPLRSPTRQETP